MFSLRSISADTFEAEWPKQTAAEGLLSAVGIALALLIGTLTGHPAGGAIAAGAAFTIGFAVFHPVMRSILLSMVLVTLAIASATLAGSLSAHWTLAVMLVVGVAALNYGLLSGLGTSAGWISQQSGVFLVVATYFPLGLHYAVGRASAVLAGGLLQILLHGLAFHFLRRTPRQPILWSSFVGRLRAYWDGLPDQLRWEGETLPYAVRLILTLLISTAIYRGFALRNGYWVPMTALLVLRPQWSGTLSRSFARLSGTLLGALLAFGLARFHGWPQLLLAALVIMCAWACYALQAVNYALFSFFITLYIVFLFRFGGFSEQTAAHLRLINTAIGGAVALLLDLVWNLLAPARARDAAR